ncbi:MAG: FtsX-like permease family protein [Clostridia bacterium]
MVKNTLHRKLMRDMWQNRMQLLAMILLCALGTCIFSGLDAAWRMVDLSSSTFFENQVTADFWVSMQAADHTALSRVREMNGVKDVQARATAELKVDLPHEPSLLVEAYDDGMRINTPLIRSGEGLAQSDLRGCVLDEMFAKENNLKPGDKLPLKLGEDIYTFTIRGTCLSAEFTALSKGFVRDPLNFGYVLLNHQGMSALPLNDLLITLEDGADAKSVRASIGNFYPDALVVDRVAQSSTYRVQTDVDMFRNLSYLFPLLAFGVAAMIVLTTVTRMVENQRQQMGMLRALGFRNGPLLRHYMSYGFYPALIGSLIGMFVGRATLPYVLWELELAQYTFPYCLQAPISWEQCFVCALGVALSCGICLRTYRKSAKEQPADLLRPKPPKAGKKLLLERCTSIWKRMSFNGKMIMRNLFRNKLRAIMSLTGVLCCTMLLITSLGLQDSVAFFVGKYYNGTLRYSVRADLRGAVGEIESYRKRIEAESVEGVMERNVSARSKTVERTTQLSILEDNQRLMYLGPDETFVELPQTGVMITQKLAQVLKVGLGDTVDLWLAGDDEPIRSQVSAIAYITVGQGIMMRRSQWELLKKGEFSPTALLIQNPTAAGLEKVSNLDELDTLKYPTDQYDETLTLLNSMMGVFTLMSVAALGLAFVVLYNMGVLNFMERYREYATLKVLGYHQKEIRHLMVAENNLITGLGVLLGIVPGRWLTAMVLRSCENDTMVFASTVHWQSYVIACVVTFAFSYFITRLLTRKVKGIDMVEALKSVE